MKERIAKIKQHVKDNKQIYISCGVTGVVAVVGTLIVVSQRGETNPLIHSAGNFNYKPTTHNKVTIKTFEALGDPGNVVHDLTSGAYYPSQGAAARVLGIPPGRVSEHLHGKSSHAGGHVLEVIGKAGDVDVLASSR